MLLVTTLTWGFSFEFSMSYYSYLPFSFSFEDVAVYEGSDTCVPHTLVSFQTCGDLVVYVAGSALTLMPWRWL